MATASVLFEKTQDEAGGVERSCSDDVIRDALTPMSLDLDGGGRCATQLLCGSLGAFSWGAVDPRRTLRP
jgi:hypothetical protein